LKESKHDLVPCDLIVTFNKKPVFVPEFGLLPVRRDSLVVVEDKVKS
jgi:hypothetical protein